jgi:hypothetical protein
MIIVHFRQYTTDGGNGFAVEQEETKHYQVDLNKSCFFLVLLLPALFMICCTPHHLVISRELSVSTLIITAAECVYPKQS